MANGTTKRAPTGVVGAWKLLADPVGAAVTEAPSCDASMWSPLLQLVAVCLSGRVRRGVRHRKGPGAAARKWAPHAAYGDVTGVGGSPAQVRPGRPRDVARRHRDRPRRKTLRAVPGSPSPARTPGISLGDAVSTRPSPSEGCSPEMQAWTAAQLGRSFGGTNTQDSASPAADGTLRRPRPGHRTAAPVDPTHRHGAGRPWVLRGQQSWSPDRARNGPGILRSPETLASLKDRSRDRCRPTT